MLLRCHLAAVVLISSSGCQFEQRANTWEYRSGDTTLGEGTVVESPTARYSSSTAFTSAPDEDAFVHASAAFPTGNPDSSVIVIEKIAPAVVNKNADFSYDLRVTNLTDLDLTNVVVFDRFAPTFELVSSTPVEPRVEADTASWNLPHLPPRTTREIRVTGTARGEGAVSSSAWVEYTPSAAISSTIADPKLELALTAPESSLPCDEIRLAYSVANPGSGVLKDVQVSSPLPNGWYTADGASNVTFSVDRLPGGSTREFETLVRASEPGDFDIEARATSGAMESTAGIVTTTIAKPSIRLEVTAPDRAFLGRPIPLTIEVDNPGPHDAESTIVELLVPFGGEFVKADGGGFLEGSVITWRLGTLPASESRELRAWIQGTIAGPTETRATAEAHCVEPVSEGLKLDLEGIPALMLEVADLADPVQIGESVTYEISVVNQGSAAATNIRIECELESYVRLVSATGATEGSGEGAKITFEPLESLAPQEVATWKAVIRGSGEGDSRFRVRMVSDQLTRPVDETEATLFYE